MVQNINTTPDNNNIVQVEEKTDQYKTPTVIDDQQLQDDTGNILNTKDPTTIDHGIGTVDDINEVIPNFDENIEVFADIITA